jgi:hypothetical protein
MSGRMDARFGNEMGLVESSTYVSLYNVSCCSDIMIRISRYQSGSHGHSFQNRSVPLDWSQDLYNVTSGLQQEAYLATCP